MERMARSPGVGTAAAGGGGGVATNESGGETDLRFLSTDCDSAEEGEGRKASFGKTIPGKVSDTTPGPRPTRSK